MSKKPICISISGPVGSGKTTLIEILCKNMRNSYQLAVITIDFFFKKDQQILITSSILEPRCVFGIKTSKYTNIVIHDGNLINFIDIEKLIKKFSKLDIIFIENTRDVFSSDFSSKFVNVNIYVIDVSRREKIFCNGGSGIICSDVLVINKIDLAPNVGVSLNIIEKKINLMRCGLPWVFANLNIGIGFNFIVNFIIEKKFE